VNPLLLPVLTLADRLMEGPLQDATVVDESTAPSLTIGIATHDDFDGAWFTINSLYLHHFEAMKNAEVVLLDNHPRGVEASDLKQLDTLMPGVRYIPVGAYSSTAIRNQIFTHARGEVVVVLDSHILLAPGALMAVVEWFVAHPDSRDLVHGPSVGSNTRRIGATHMNPIWSAGMFGKWDTGNHIDDRDNLGHEAFEIPLNGLAAFACRREVWPGLNTKFVGFGGEEGYIHEKFRQHGGTVLCLPAFQWLHRFARPKGVKYPLNWPDRIRNYAIGWSELGLDVDEMTEHFVDVVKIPEAPDIVARVRRGIQTAFWDADGVLCINDDLRPGLLRDALGAFAEFGIVPLRVSRPDDGSVDEDLAAARALMTDMGWRSAVVVGERAVLSVDDVVRADGVLRAGGSLEERDFLVTRIKAEEAR
jgi:hypothetical protein